MRYTWVCGMVLFVAFATQGAEKKLPIEQVSNELVSISATAFVDKDQIHQELGADLGPEMVLVRVTFRPVSEKALRVNLDDFLLVSAKDGQRAQPFAPSQIAGSAALVVTPQTAKSGGKTGLTLGGFGIGRSSASDAPADAKVESVKSDKEDPLLAVLTAKCLPEKETSEEVSGLLYFQMNGKLKPKDLELHYKGPAGRLALRFRP